MSQGDIITECLREYEKDRDNQAKLLTKRKDELYEAIPRLREIDLELSKAWVYLTKTVLSGGGDINGITARLNKENAQLKREKAQLMNAAGYKRTYLDAAYKCKLCKDTGYADGKRCVCFNQKLIDKRYSMSNIRDRLKYENFEYFDIRYYPEEKDEKGITPRANIKRIYQICVNFIKNFDKTYQNLLFYGNTGLGKTFLCNCIAKDLLDMGKVVLYITAPKLFKYYENYRFNKEELTDCPPYADLVNTADLLIIDDLGAEFITVISASELFNIINTRILEQKHTVISTNLNPVTDFEDSYSQRIVSRFVGDYIMLKFTGTDIRKAKKYLLGGDCALNL